MTWYHLDNAAGQRILSTTSLRFAIDASRDTDFTLSLEVIE